MDINCIALDLDRTTLNAHGRLSDENRQALEYAISRGVHIIIASGRPLRALPEDVLSVAGIEYAITSNGAAVYHLPTGIRLAHFPMNPSMVDRLLQLTANLPCVCETFVDGQAYAGADFLAAPSAFGAPEHAVPYLQRTRKPVDNITEFMKTHRSELDSIDLIVDGQETRDRLRVCLQPHLPDCYITTSVPHLLEFSHRDCGKHSGVRVVAEILGLSPKQIAAFGDGDNDADMLNYVGCGIAVANASPACLAAADRTTAAFDQNGVALGIYQLLKPQLI